MTAAEPLAPTAAGRPPPTQVLAEERLRIAGAAGNWTAKPGDDSFFDTFRPYEEHLAFMNAVAAEHPEVVTVLEPIGRTVCVRGCVASPRCRACADTGGTGGPAYRPPARQHAAPLCTPTCAHRRCARAACPQLSATAAAPHHGALLCTHRARSNTTCREGRPIPAVRLSGRRRGAARATNALYLQSTVHAREWLATTSLAWTLKKLAEGYGEDQGATCVRAISVTAAPITPRWRP